MGGSLKHGRCSPITTTSWRQLKKGREHSLDLLGTCTPSLPKEINRQDETPGRKVWFQYWDSHLTYPQSYLARLNYVHCNAVKHGLVREPALYPWCSAGWFEREAERSFYQTVMRIRSDRVNVRDDFEVNAADVQ